MGVHNLNYAVVCVQNQETFKEWVILHFGECDYCPICSDDIDPVCAEFEGQTLTFDNICKVEAENCRSKTDWKIVSKNACGINNCPNVCPFIYSPVCAINNGEARTFSNICEMRKEACNTNTAWNIVSNGECPAPNGNCPESCSLEYSPVCGLYQGLYREFTNECFMRSEICKSQKNWEFVNAGPCSDQTPVSEPITPIQNTESQCEISKCLAFPDPVCAIFNGEKRTFPNACYLHNVKCKTGEDWRIIKHSRCRKPSRRSRISPGNDKKC